MAIGILKGIGMSVLGSAMAGAATVPPESGARVSDVPGASESRRGRGHLAAGD